MKLKIATCFLFFVVMFHGGVSDAEHGPPLGCSVGYDQEVCLANATFVKREIQGDNLVWSVQVTYEPSDIECAHISIGLTGVDRGGEWFITSAPGYGQPGVSGPQDLYRNGLFIHQSGEIKSAAIPLSFLHYSSPENLGIFKVNCSYYPSVEEQQRRMRQVSEEAEEFLVEDEQREPRYLDENRGKLEDLDLARQEEERMRREKEMNEVEEEVERKMALEGEFEYFQDLEEESDFEVLEEEEIKRRVEELLALGESLENLNLGEESGNPERNYDSPSPLMSSNQSCEQAKLRGARLVASQPMPSGNSMCGSFRFVLRMNQTAKRILQHGGCPAYEVSQYDSAIAQARKGVRATCGY